MQNRSPHWQLRSRRIDFPAWPLVMGILNVTPDSFSEGGLFAGTEAAIEQGLRMAAEGADLIDVGGESTRPYSQPVEEAEELRRVVPVVRALAEQTGVPISVDTSKAAVAREAMAAGAEIINDVTALAGDPRMVQTALDTQAAVCAMHMLGTPQTMQDSPTYQDVVAEIYDFLRRRRDSLLAAGIAQDRITLDPGIGFGKTHAHNLTLLANCRRFHALGSPLLVGHSRKGFIGKVIGDKTADLTAGTVGVTLALASQGVQIVRVHDVAANVQALKLFVAAGGIESNPHRAPAPRRA